MLSKVQSKLLKLEYLETMSASELAYWLIHSFTPERYRDINDPVKRATEILQAKAGPELYGQFMVNLWAMHGLLPDMVDNVIPFRRNKNV